jgi:putative oxidoreductase
MMNRYAHLAPLLLRLALGAVFIVHGLPKFLSTGAVAQFFGQVGIPAPYAMVLLVGAVEVIGGALLLIGYGTRIAAALLALDMLGAIVTAKLSMGFVNGWEFEAVLLAATLSLILSGPMGHRVPESEQALI